MLIGERGNNRIYIHNTPELFLSDGLSVLLCVYSVDILHISYCANYVARSVQMMGIKDRQLVSLSP